MAVDEEDIYQEHVLDHYEDPFHRGHCDCPTHRHQDDNPLCGDVIRVELRVGPDDRIEQAWFNGDGCCISQASASMLMERIEGSTLEEVRKFTAEDMLKLFGARLTPNRQKCCLLSWRVVQSALYAPVERGSDNAPGPTQSGPRVAEESQ